ncbi:MAG: hypothetical protein KGJ06_04520 [Pseudomonadota bacterium]|nr:hypothetical protein [Pseudomonadota bacterium]
MASTDTLHFERHVLLLMGMVQFINIWDFMIVMPLGPDFARAAGAGGICRLCPRGSGGTAIAFRA